MGAVPVCEIIHIDNSKKKKKSTKLNVVRALGHRVTVYDRQGPKQQPWVGWGYLHPIDARVAAVAYSEACLMRKTRPPACAFCSAWQNFVIRSTVSKVQSSCNWHGCRVPIAPRRKALRGLAQKAKTPERHRFSPALHAKDHGKATFVQTCNNAERMAYARAYQKPQTTEPTHLRGVAS